MKTKLHLLFWLFALVPLAFTSCDDDETFVDETTLSTSLSSVTFTKDGGQQSVSITTSATTWVATSPLESSWLTLTQNGAQLDITAAPNTEGVDRKGYILVNAGSAAAKINVVQSAGDATFILTPSSIEFQKLSASQRIDIIGEGTFTVEADAAAAEWLSIDYQPGADFFNVSVSDFNEQGTREGKVIVTSETSVSELVVTQVGVEAILLPFINKESTGYAAVFQYELSRGNALGDVPQIFGNDYYTFTTSNPNFPLAAYWYNDITGNNYQQGSTLTTNVTLFSDGTFDNFMTEKGFTYNDADGSYTNPEYPYIITVSLSATSAQINAIYQPVQSEEYPTWDELPLIDPQMSWNAVPANGIHGATLEEVQEWEESQGATLSDEDTGLSIDELVMFEVSAADQEDGFYQRFYWRLTNADVTDPSYVGEVSSACCYVTDISKVIWSEDGMSYQPTTEFLALLASEGFSYNMTSDGYDFYTRINDEESYLEAYCFGINGTVIDIQTFRQSTIATSMLDLMSNKNLMENTMSQLAKRVKQNQKIRSAIHK